MTLKFLVAILLALVMSLALNRLLLAVAPRLGLMDQPGKRRIHTTPIPRVGGLAIWLSFMLIIGGGLMTGWLTSSGILSWSWLTAFAAGSGVLVIVGLLDDRKGLSPWVKLAAHVLAPSVFFLLHPIQVGFPEGWSHVFDYAVFVTWVVVLINAFNLIDGLDGLCGGLAALASLALAGMALVNGRTDAALLLLVMGGAILGFLKYNLNPARIFLGDTGSMLMGFFLATAATDAVGRKAVVGIILLPIAVAGVPLLDVLLAIWRRGMRRLLRQLHGEKIEGGIFDADQEHLHHRLLTSGGTQHKVAMVLQGIAIFMATLAFLPMLYGGRMVTFTIVGFLLVGLVGLKNLAWVEIEHTGNVIHMAIKLPGHRRRMAAVLFVYDLLVLTGAAVAASLIETNCLIQNLGADLGHLARFVAVFVLISVLALWALRVHQRLWVRATIRDIVSLQLWLLLAAMVSFTLFTLVYTNFEWRVLRLTMMSYTFGCAGVCLPRVALDMLRELGLDARFRHKKHAPNGHYGPVVVLGAGDLGALLLGHLKTSSHDLYPGLRVLGFIDEMQVLHGRQMLSLRVLGGLSIVPKLVAEDGLQGIILAIRQPDNELLAQLETLTEKYQLKIYRWRAELEKM